MKSLFLALLLTGCASPRDYTQLTKQVGEYGIQRFEDKPKNVTCWLYRDDDGSVMACLNNKNKGK